jgi:hypothetical protein
MHIPVLHTTFSGKKNLLDFIREHKNRFYLTERKKERKKEIKRKIERDFEEEKKK